LFPPSLFAAVLSMTTVLYAVLLSAKFQAQRYFVPILLVWEILLPFYIFSLAEKMPDKKNKALCYGFAGLLIAYQVVFFLYSIRLSYTPILLS
jgi:hypothetical protein